MLHWPPPDGAPSCPGACDAAPRTRSAKRTARLNFRTCGATARRKTADSGAEGLEPRGDLLGRPIPSPLFRHLPRGRVSTAPRFLAVLVDVPQKEPQVLRVRFGPPKSLVVGALRHRGDRRLHAQ